MILASKKDSVNQKFALFLSSPGSAIEPYKSHPAVTETANKVPTIVISWAASMPQGNCVKAVANCKHTTD